MSNVLATSQLHTIEKATAVTKNAGAHAGHGHDGYIAANSPQSK